MTGSYGAYQDEWEPPLSTLRLAFSRLDLVSSWRRCGVVADFAAEFLADDFESPEASAISLSGIMNEVVENAVKFSLGGDEALKLALFVWGDRIVIETRHPCELSQAQRLQGCISRLETGDPETLFIEQLTHTALSAPESSGLGLITLCKDFGAVLGLRVLPVGEGVVKIAFQVRLPIDRLV